MERCVFKAVMCRKAVKSVARLRAKRCNTARTDGQGECQPAGGQQSGTVSLFCVAGNESGDILGTGQWQLHIKDLLFERTFEISLTKDKPESQAYNLPLSCLYSNQ